MRRVGLLKGWVRGQGDSRLVWVQRKGRSCLPLRVECVRRVVVGVAEGAMVVVGEQVACGRDVDPNCNL